MTLSWHDMANTHRLDIFLAGLSVVAAMAVPIGLSAFGVRWTDWLPATCMPDGCFCEAVRSGWLRQPSNVISSLAFCVVAALVVLGRGAPAGGSDDREDRYLFWVTATFIGLGSSFFHASLTFVGQTFDLLGMYLLATLLLLWSARRRLAWTSSQRVAVYVLGNIVLLAILIVWPALRRYVFAALVAGVLLAERSNRSTDGALTSRKYLLMSVGLLLAGFLIWILDLTKILCDPGSVLQGHAAWHLLGAGAALMAYAHYHQRPRAGVT